MTRATLMLHFNPIDTDEVKTLTDDAQYMENIKPQKQLVLKKPKPTLYRKAAKRAPARPSPTMGCARAPASLLAEVEDEAADDVELPVLLLEPDPPDVVDEPELLPLVLGPLEVPLVLLPPDVVPLVLEPLPTVPLVELEPDPTPVEGETTGTRVELTAAGGVYVGVPAGLVATAG